MYNLRKLIRSHNKLSAPIISVVAGSGQITKSAVASGADLIIALNAGFLRNIGFGSLAAFMPYGNANDQTEQLLRHHILPHRKATPVVAGVFASDPEQPIIERLKKLKELGVEGITNWPAVGFFDGNFRAHLENEGFGIAAEAEMLKQAKELGFVTFGFALTAQDAAVFAKNDVDALILNVGLTFETVDTIEKRNQLQLSITKAKDMLMHLSASGRTPLTIVYGGPITQPEDFEEFVRQVPIHGYAGGSVFDRFPVLETVILKVKSFKQISAKERVAPPAKFGNLVGSSASMKRLFALIQKIAPYDVNVCIEGESGTGKELVANQIHILSPRKNHPFITVNCGAIPDTLVESEFFGYEKGAFTGAAHRKLGKFELAHKGTLFLDEIADLSPHAQAALLRVIQEGEVITLGGQKHIPVDVRILCASNQDLEKLVQEGKFRVDLYFRLSTIVMRIPSLNERKDDIPLLVSNVLAKLSVKFNKKLIGITDEFMNELKNYDWKGNVRQLEQVMTRHALMEEKPVLSGGAFWMKGETSDQGAENDYRFQKAQQALIAAGYNKTKAAAGLKISRKTLYLWLNSGSTNSKL
ncbi:MAG TPA: phosphoenolpyruvate hydrolase family protein [Cyclobacteriaceae bacterium]|nr:phosphoenolpyruvate hydrolase family protein [Cyclobacteriaceae bacterium]